MAYNYTLHGLATGKAGVRQTLKMMDKLARDYKTAPLIRETALNLVRNLPPKKWAMEVNAIHCFVRDRIRYVRDVLGVETLQSPVQTLRIGQGDCDDKATLIAALLAATGHPYKFVAVGFQNKDHFSHVFPQTIIGDKWVTLETTEKWPLGRTPQKIKAIMYQNMSKN